MPASELHELQQPIIARRHPAKKEIDFFIGSEFGDEWRRLKSHRFWRDATKNTKSVSPGKSMADSYYIWERPNNHAGQRSLIKHVSSFHLHCHFCRPWHLLLFHAKITRLEGGEEGKAARKKRRMDGIQVSEIPQKRR